PRRTCPWVSRMPSASPPTLSMRSRLRSVEASWDGEEASLTPAPDRAECGGKEGVTSFRPPRTLSARQQMSFACAIHPDRHGRARPHFRRLGRWPYLLFVEPRLIGNLDVV